ncbi:MAG: hypothetical protein ACREQ9_08165 [Candidatus Binatia bacterium]
MVEVAGKAGDVVLVHPWLLHVRPVNPGSEPRFLLAKDLMRRKLDAQDASAEVTR